jgi:glutathione S-transferase
MSLVLHEHPFAAYCWKALIAFYECDVPFERAFVGGQEDRDRLARLWPVGSIPVLVDGERVLGESSAIVEHVTPQLVPDLDARLWDRVLDGQVMTPMQKIVADALRPDDARDPYGVAEARATLDRAYALLDARATTAWLAGGTFTLADCAAAPALFYAWVVHPWAGLPSLTAYYERLTARPSVARVIDEARPYRELFPPGWPAHVD